MTTNSRKVQAGLYCRISDDRTGGRLGVERQRKDCTDLANRLGWAVADTYTDNDISAFTGKRRPEYERLLADINHGKITGLVTWHPDRLNRSPLELERLIGVLERNGVSVQSVTAGVLDLATPSGRAVVRTLGAWARFESEHKSERIRAKKLETALAGEPSTGGPRGFGYAIDRRTVLEDEAEVIREMVRRFLRGDSLVAIARSLNGRGLTTTAGGRWTSYRISRLLVSGRIAGWRDKPVYRPDDRRYSTEFLTPGTWPAIVSRADVARARVLLRDDTVCPGSPRRRLLADIAACGRCGALLTSRSSPNQNGRYQCARNNYGGNGCGRLSINSYADDLVVAQIAAELRNGLVDRLGLRGIDTHLDAIEADRQVDRLLAKTRRDYSDSLISHDEYLSSRSHLGHCKRRSLRALADLEAFDITTLSAETFSDTWAAVSMRQRRGVLRALAASITVLPVTRGTKADGSNRVNIEWRA